MDDLSPAEIQANAQAEREHTATERSRDRRGNVLLTGLSGVMVLSGAVGGQLISHYDREPAKTPTYNIELSEKSFDCYSRNTVLRINSQTGETWYARKRSDGIFEWVQISNDAQPSIPSSVEPCTPASAGPTKSLGR
jgi:hypothetical protein